MLVPRFNFTWPSWVPGLASGSGAEAARDPSVQAFNTVAGKGKVHMYGSAAAAKGSRGSMGVGGSSGELLAHELAACQRTQGAPCMTEASGQGQRPPEASQGEDMPQER